MKRLLAAVCVVFGSQQSDAADISVVSAAPGRPAIIRIKGKFEKEYDDLSRFRENADKEEVAVVFFEGMGGLARTGVKLGQLIRERGFMTAVADHAICASACALAWLGGKHRFMGKEARIGFHAPRQAGSFDGISKSSIKEISSKSDFGSGRLPR